MLHFDIFHDTCIYKSLGALAVEFVTCASPAGDLVHGTMYSSIGTGWCLCSLFMTCGYVLGVVREGLFQCLGFMKDTGRPSLQKILVILYSIRYEMNGILKYNGYHSVLGDLEVLLVMALRFLYDGLRIFARRKDVVKYTVMFVGCCLG